MGGWNLYMILVVLKNLVLLLWSVILGIVKMVFLGYFGSITTTCSLMELISWIVVVHRFKWHGEQGRNEKAANIDLKCNYVKIIFIICRIPLRSRDTKGQFTKAASAKISTRKQRWLFFFKRTKLSLTFWLIITDFYVITFIMLVDIMDREH